MVWCNSIIVWNWSLNVDRMVCNGWVEYCTASQRKSHVTWQHKMETPVSGASAAWRIYIILFDMQLRWNDERCVAGIHKGRDARCGLVAVSKKWRMNSHSFAMSGFVWVWSGLPSYYQFVQFHMICYVVPYDVDTQTRNECFEMRLSALYAWWVYL